MFNPEPGDLVCDCRFQHLKIKVRDDDDLILEDGFSCSLIDCCDPPEHDWPHPDPANTWNVAPCH